MNRTRLLALGCVGWGSASIVIAWTSYFWVFCLSRLVVGASMAFVGPIHRALLADLVACAVRASAAPLPVCFNLACSTHARGAVLATSSHKYDFVIFI
jgi:predicted MFS family arabinose efflux permease